MIKFLNPVLHPMNFWVQKDSIIHSIKFLKQVIFNEQILFRSSPQARAQLLLKTSIMESLTTQKHSRTIKRINSGNTITGDRQKIRVSFFLIGFVLMLSLTIGTQVQAQQIVSKPESLKVYAQDQTIAIEARKEIDYLELWDMSKSKRRLKFKPKNQSIRVNTQRLKKSDYQIVLFFGNDTKLIKFTK